MKHPGGLNEDFRDLLEELLSAGVEFVVVGAHAVAAQGYPRATKDLDVWVRPSTENAVRVYDALGAFGAPLAMHGVVVEDFATPGIVYQMGLPPFRIDLLTRIDAVGFEEAWQGRLEQELDGLVVPFLGREQLLKNKAAAGRPQDLADLARLQSQV
jgi:predicted nucleotidyltransferase